MAGQLLCYRCGASLQELPLPLGRLDECPACSVQLHCCRMCVYYDPRVPRQCREDDAEDVRDKFTANFCDYFKPSPDAHDPRFAAADARARDALASLFGDGEGGPDESPATDADKLFK